LNSRVVHPDARVGWRQAAKNQPLLVDIDEQGLQHFTSSAKDKSRILIIGASVASGAYASLISKTYYHLIGEALENQHRPSDIVILAAGGWKSSQELAALRAHAGGIKPEAIVLLNGLNDLTNGARADVLAEQPVPTHDGSPWTPTYHAHDYTVRVRRYLENIREAAKLAADLDSALLVVLQPSLAEKRQKTAVEMRLLDLSLIPHTPRASIEALEKSYQDMRAGLGELECSGAIHFFDASRIFDAETHTVFADLWHFSDFGHEILARAMTPRLAFLLAVKSSS
jgi:hypothetical protein